MRYWIGRGSEWETIDVIHAASEEEALSLARVFYGGVKEDEIRAAEIIK